ncbi:hypothetical protein [Streptomyces hoynatensis]|uniref:hypothetical protein n=1 Tax=Streptomyces hoynatensis TaxID=1141874 RepID=UPI001F4EE3B8|nr:hypothetical protein [Streptomyces hoynatensis]
MIGGTARLETDRESPTWFGANVYKYGGYLIGDIPVVGEHLQTAVDQAISSWLEHESRVIDQRMEDYTAEYYGTENEYLAEMTRQWLQSNPAPPRYGDADAGQWPTDVAQEIQLGARAGHDDAEELRGHRS